MNRKQMEYFLKVYEAGSITRAARQLYLSPQALSKTILALEQEMGTKLFERAGRQMRPTVAASWLREHALRILEEYRQIEKKQYLEQGRRKTLRLFYTYGVMEYLTVEFILQFQRMHPEILLSMAEIPDAMAMQKMRAGEAELSLLSDPVDITLFAAQKLYACRYCVVMHESHPLAQKETIRNQDLRGYPLVVKGREFALYHAQMTDMSRQGAEPYVALETTSYHLAHQLAAANLALGFSLEYLALGDPIPHMVVRPFVEEGVWKNVSLVQRRGQALSDEAECFKRFLLEWLRR